MRIAKSSIKYNLYLYFRKTVFLWDYSEFLAVETIRTGKTFLCVAAQTVVILTVVEVFVQIIVMILLIRRKLRDVAIMSLDKVCL